MSDSEQAARSIRGELAKYLGIDSWNFARVFENVEREVLIPLISRVTGELEAQLREVRTELETRKEEQRAEGERLEALLGIAQTERDRLREALEAAQSILWMAENYAEGGGSSGPEMRDYAEVSERIRAAIAKAEGK